MTKEVLLKISGQHLDAQSQEDLSDGPIEIISPAAYYLKNGKHYVLFDEVQEGFSGVTKSQIKITDNRIVEIKKSGVTNSHMTFEKYKDSLTVYETPYGPVKMGVHTRDVRIDVGEEHIHVEVEYGLDINQEAVSDCTIHLDIRPKAQAGSILDGR